MPRPAAPAGATSPGPVSFDHADWRVPNARELMGPARISDPASPVTCAALTRDVTPHR